MNFTKALGIVELNKTKTQEALVLMNNVPTCYIFSLQPGKSVRDF